MRDIAIEVTRNLALVASFLFLDAEQQDTANPATFGKIPDNTPERTACSLPFAEQR